MCGDAALAEEAAQEAFLRAWQNLGRYNPRFAFRSWVYRIALNVAVDALRRERPTTDPSTGSPLGPAAPAPLGPAAAGAAGPKGAGGQALTAEPLASNAENPEAWLERKQQAEQVRRAVLDLPPASRSVLVLREYEGLSYHEIAEALDIPLGTVMSRLNYARGQLRRALSRPPEER
jgi:RNA polymerase sigma-70 factor (ECF subfamily)